MPEIHDYPQDIHKELTEMEQEFAESTWYRGKKSVARVNEDPPVERHEIGFQMTLFGD